MDKTEIPEGHAEKVAKAKAITQSRILSQDDFHKLRMRQVQKQMEADPKRGKRKTDIMQLIEDDVPDK